MKNIVKISCLAVSCCIHYSIVFSQSLKDTLSFEEVVITGSRVEVSRKNLPVNVSVISASQIDEIEESAILPVISRRIPGLFVNERGVTGFGRTGSESAGNVSIRGVGGSPNAQVLVLIDGHPQYMGIFGHPLPNNYVASDIDRVEVIRGPASILYGSNAMGGVLNIITRDEKKEGFSGAVRIGYGSFNTQKYMANTGFRKNKLSLFVSFNHDQTDGHRDSMAFNINNGYIKAGYKLNEHISITADYNLADFTSYDPGRDIDEAMVNTFRADITRGKTSFSVDNKYNRIEGGLIGYYNFGKHSFSDTWESDDENYGFSFYQGLKLFKGNLLTAGIDHKTFGGRGNIAFPPTYANQWLTVHENAAYLIARQDIGMKIIFSAGLRMEDNSLFGTELIPQAGASFNKSDKTNFKFSVSRGFRSPTIAELYLFAPNQELKPENMINYDATWSQVLVENRLRTMLTLFYLKGSNIIISYRNPSPPPQVLRDNSGNFEHKGFEFEVFYRQNKNLSADLSYSYLNMNKPKLVSPEHQVFLGVSYKLNKFDFVTQINYVGGLYIMTGQIDNTIGDIRENYITLNASMKYHPFSFMEIYFTGKNLLNAQYSIDYGYPMPGINLMTGVGLKF